MQHTMVEKVLSRASGLKSVAPGQGVTTRPDRLLANESFAACARELLQPGVKKIAHPETVVVVLERCYPASNAADAEERAAARDLARRLDVGRFLGHEGTCHQVLCEQGLAMPGTLVAGIDPQTTTCGALGAAGTGIGLREMAGVMATGELYLQVPASVRVVLDDIRRWECVTSRDVILHLLGKLGGNAWQHKSVEFSGEAAEAMSADGRMTMADLASELGAGFAFFAADEVALGYISRQTGAKVLPFGPDRGAAYESEHRVDIGDLEPQVAGLRGPSDVRSVTELGEVEVRQAFLGSRAGARLQDLAVAAVVLRGRTIAADSRLVVTPASRQVYLRAVKAGLIEVFLEAGADITAPGCGACPGGNGSVFSAGEACISSGHRNPPDGEEGEQAPVYLGSAATVAASAVAGRIADPREFWQPEAA
jgi:3-isopropylmalate/(R)-2-methylmalate dehydratase large subunit